MKKLFSYFGVTLFVALLLGSAVVACSNDSDIISEQTTKKELKNLQGYFETSNYTVFLKQNDLTGDNLQLDNIAIESFNDKGADVYIIPVEKNNKLIGKLHVITYRESYKTIYEDWSDATEEKNNGTVKVSTGEGEYIATLNVMRKDGKVISQIEDVAELKTTRADGESWWGCTTRIYYEAKKACGTKSSCEFLCDISDIVARIPGQCTISVATAAAIACAIYG